MSPQGHRPGPDSRTLPGPAVFRRLQSPRLQSRAALPASTPNPGLPRAIPQPPHLGGRWESWEIWENWEDWETWELWEQWESKPLQSSLIPPFLSQSSQFSQSSHYSHNSQSSHLSRLRVTDESGDWRDGRIEGRRGEVEIGGQNKSHPPRSTKPMGMAFSFGGGLGVRGWWGIRRGGIRGVGSRLRRRGSGRSGRGRNRRGVASLGR